MRYTIPRSSGVSDYSNETIEARQRFIKERSGADFKHLKKYSFKPEICQGNIEHFTGVAQIPVGFAGPLLMNGEHAKGEFYVPMATTEGTLLASYNRGMRLLYDSGGVSTSVCNDAMQRAPVFVFENVREAKEFGVWLNTHFQEIKTQAEATTKSGKLVNIEQYCVGKMLYTRFNFTTGDAAGQNMVSKATFFACEWIKANNSKIKRYLLSGNIDTDKKTSFINTLHTRGKRVVAEATIPRQLMEKMAGTSLDVLYRQRQISTVGAFMSGANNNGAHSANGITAVFIATGQDVANVSESSAAIIYTEITESGDYYYSVTLPSLIVATYGGGTGLATQRECLEIMDCYGKDKVYKLAEIIAATVMAGELSLGSAIMAGEWVESHDKYGRNRP